VRYDTPVEKYEIFIQAQTAAGKKASVNSTVHFCGYETVKSISSTKAYEVDMDAIEEPLTFPLADLFSVSDVGCPISNFTLKMESGDPSETKDLVDSTNKDYGLNFELIGENFVINPIISGTYEFYLVAKTGSSIYSEMQITVKLTKMLDAVASLTNIKPSWSSPLELSLEVAVNIDENGEADDTSNFEYRTPTAIDSEGDSISIEVQGMSALPCVTGKQNSDDSFTLKINRALITTDSVGTH